jgi:hypothetical protein
MINTKVPLPHTCMCPSAFNKTMIYTMVVLPHTCMYPSAFNKTMIYTKVVLRHHTCMREENLSVYHYFIEALAHIHV